MKKGRKLSKKVLSLILITTMILTSMPSSALTIFANDGEATKHDNPWDYTIFGNSIKIPVNLMSGSVIIDGDIHANNSIISLGEEININGTAEAGEEVTLGDTSGDDSSDISVDEIVTNAEHIELPNIYDSILYNEKNKASYYEPEDADDILRKSIISDAEISISDDSYSSNDILQKKAGAFGAGFLTEVYENLEDWANILPVFANDTTCQPDENGKISLIELCDNSYFAGVQELSVDDSKFKDYNKLPDSIFMDNLNAGYTTDYLNSLKSENPVFNICSDNTTTINAVWDNYAVNPEPAQNVEKINVTGGNLTLNGDYSTLKEFKISGYGNIQLLGNYQNLEYIYADGYGNLNLAGNFPSLKAVYMSGGQLLLGTADIAFNTDGATIINENGTVTVYAAKSTTITNSTVITNSNMAIRGDGVSESKFIADGSTFAAKSLILGDMKDTNLEYSENIPSFFSQSGLSIINCDFEKLQGFFMTRNGKMVLSDSNIKLFAGFLFAQQGIDKTSTTASEGVYVETSGYNQSTGVANESYQPNGQTVGGIQKIQYAQLPDNALLINGMTEFNAEVKQQKNSDGEYVDKYETGLNDDEEAIIYILSEEDIIIDVDSFKTPDGRRMIIASKNGNITLKATTVDFDGVLYAPSGTVQIQATENLDINGRVYGDIVDLSASTMNVNSSDDDLNKNLLDIENQIIFILPPFTYVENKDLYIYDEESAQIDYILYTNKEVDEIQAIAINYEDYGSNETGQTFWSTNSHDNGKLFSLEYAEIFAGPNVLQIKVKFTDGTYYTEDYKIYRLDPNNTDTDNDGLTNDEEYFIGTDKTKADTDGDGLTDGYEVYILSTNPLNIDTNSNGINDGDEDFDGDGISNITEINTYLTDPSSEDTDNDGLTDYEEIFEQLTDPCEEDTDNDTINDNDEFAIGLNPNNSETFGYPDVEYKITQNLGSEDLVNIKNIKEFDVSIEIKSTGNAKTDLKANTSVYNDMVQENGAVLGKVIDFEYIDHSYDGATIKFDISHEQSTAEIDRFKIFKYDDSANIIYPVETLVDETNNIIYTETTSLGSYGVIDIEKWLYNMGIKDEEQEASLLALTDEEDLATVSSSDIEFVPNLPIDIMFVVDTSGSMGSSLNKCKNNMKSIVDSLYDSGYTANIGVVSFKDYFDTGTYNVKTYTLGNDTDESKEYFATTADEAEALINKIGKDSGGTNEPAIQALETARRVYAEHGRKNSLKFMVLITDEVLQTQNDFGLTSVEMKKLLDEDNIQTAIVTSTNNDILDSFEAFSDGNNIIDITGDFTDDIINFINSKITSENLFRIVLPNGLVPAYLKAAPFINSTVDSDGDPLKDWIEIDWSNIKGDHSSGITQNDLPTYGELLESYNYPFDINTWSLPYLKVQQIKSVKVLPIHTSPAHADTDGDGLNDKEDKRPLIFAETELEKVGAEVIGYVYDEKNEKINWIHMIDNHIEKQTLDYMKNYVENNECYILVINTTIDTPNPPYVNFQVYNSYKYSHNSKIASETMQSILSYAQSKEITFPRTINGLKKEWRDHNLGYYFYSFLGDKVAINSAQHVDFDTQENTLSDYEE